MGEQVFKSPGFYAKEIDLTTTGPSQPFGTPAGIAGSAKRGPAFVPVTLASFKDFVDTFGNVDGKSFGAYAVKEFLKNAQSAVFLRVLGVGDGKQREGTATDSSGNTNRVNNAGFVVGGGQTIETNFNFQLDRNRNTTETMTVGVGGGGAGGGIANTGGKGRVFFLAALHSESAASTYLSDAGIQNSPAARSVIRGVMFAASGTILQLSASASGSGKGFENYSDLTGTYNYGDSTFTMVVRGHSSTGSKAVDFPRTVTASMDVSKANYFGKVFNRDPKKLKDFGYVLYESFDVSDALVTVTGTNVVATSGSATRADIVHLLSGTLAHNRGNSTIPNYENYEDRFTTPTSPFVISQKFGGSHQSLFRVESISDGAWANDKFKISVANIKRSTTSETDFGSFSLLVRDFNDTDESPVILEQFHNLNIDLNSENYVCRRIGDKKVYFDFNQLEGQQKLVVEGEYDNVSRLIRVVPSSDLKDGAVNDNALPMGFAGIKYLVTSGSDRLVAPIVENNGGLREALRSAIQPPLPLRKDLNVGTGNKKEVDKRMYWGVQFSRPVNVNDLNKGNKAENIAAFTRYFGNENLSAVQPPTTGSDTVNNNKFTLENLQVVTSSGGGPADQTRLTEWAYKRNGNVTVSNGTRSFDPATDLNQNSNIAKFTFILQGGFNGTDIFDDEFSRLENGAAVKESTVAALQANGPAIAGYRKGVEVLSNPDDVDINLLATPGMTEPLITDFATRKVEDRFDAMYIMDVLLRDGDKNVVSASSQKVSVKETATDHTTRGLNSNFAAAYFPDVTLFDEVNNRLVEVPASVPVLGAFAFNDKIAQPWAAAAGFVRGALNNVVSTRVDLSLSDRDTLQLANINPIATFVGQGAVVYGQKTTQQKQSALDRVNVRRLLIEVRRAVKLVSNQIIFEQNRRETLQRFTDLIEPLLERIQSQAGIDRFKVVFDETTTTQAEIDNNVIKGKIFLVPSRTIEVIAVDFSVSNSNATFR